MFRKKKLKKQNQILGYEKKKKTYIRSADQNVTILPASIEFSLIFDEIIQCMIQFDHEFGSR